MEGYRTQSLEAYCPVWGQRSVCTFLRVLCGHSIMHAAARERPSTTELQRNGKNSWIQVLTQNFCVCREKDLSWSKNH